MLPSIEQRLAVELAAKPVQIAAAVALLDEGATVPFISRYRKEATGGLDDTQLRLLEERLRYLRELEDRRAAIISSIEEQGKMTPVLLDAIHHAEDKTRLENFDGITVVDDIANLQYPMPLHAHDKDDVFVGRLRRDETQPNTLNCWIVSDNLRKGAATNAVQIAEKLVQEGFV